MYFDVQNSNPMSIFVGGDCKTSIFHEDFFRNIKDSRISDIRKCLFFRISKGFWFRLLEIDIRNSELDFIGQNTLP